MALSTTEALRTGHESLIIGSARPKLGHADAPSQQSRRLLRLTGCGANVAVARVRGPTIASTITIQKRIPR